MAVLMESKNSRLCKSNWKMPGPKGPILKAPLMPAWIPPGVGDDGSRPLPIEPQLGETEFDPEAGKTPVLRNVMFELTLACNLRCIHCYCSAGVARDSELTIDSICRFLNYLAKAEVGSITLTGGEPLLHRDFPTVVRHASDQGLGIALFTNGELLDRCVFEELENSNVRSIQISLDGARAETHDLVRGKKGLYQKTLRAITESKQRGFSVVVMTTLVTQNQHEMVEVNGMCEDLGVDAWCMNVAIPTGRAKALDPVSLHALSDIRKQVGISPAVCSSTACGVGFEKVAVLSNGDITPCEVLQSMKMGNIATEDVLSVFHHHSMMNEYRNSTVENIAECAGCPVTTLCRGGCKSSTLIRTGSIFSADPVACGSWQNAIDLAGPSGDPSHRPPSKYSTLATTDDDTLSRELFHAALTKGHPVQCLSL